jgi:hypothetical protein
MEKPGSNIDRRGFLQKTAEVVAGGSAVLSGIGSAEAADKKAAQNSSENALGGERTESVLANKIAEAGAALSQQAEQKQGLFKEGLTPADAVLLIEPLLAENNLQKITDVLRFLASNEKSLEGTLILERLRENAIKNNFKNGDAVDIVGYVDKRLIPLMQGTLIKAFRTALPSLRSKYTRWMGETVLNTVVEPAAIEKMQNDGKRQIGEVVELMVAKLNAKDPKAIEATKTVLVLASIILSGGKTK